MVGTMTEAVGRLSLSLTVAVTHNSVAFVPSMFSSTHDVSLVDATCTMEPLTLEKILYNSAFSTVVYSKTTSFVVSSFRTLLTFVMLGPSISKIKY